MLIDTETRTSAGIQVDVLTGTEMIIKMSSPMGTQRGTQLGAWTDIWTDTWT